MNTVKKGEESVEKARIFLIESGYINVQKSRRKELDLIVNDIKTEVKTAFICFTTNEIEVLEKEKCFVVFVSNQGIFLCNNYKFFDNYRVAKSVSISDEKWSFLKKEFGTDSPTEQITKLVESYKKHKKA